MNEEKFNNELEGMKNDVVIRQYFMERNIGDFVKKYIKIDEMLCNDNDVIKTDIISEQLKNIQQNNNQLKETLNTTLNSTLNTLFLELQNVKEDNMKNILDNFKEKMININQGNLNDYDRKNMNTMNDMQKVICSTLDSHVINHKINTMDTVLTSLHNNFTNGSSSRKGELTENVLFNNLIKAFPSSEVINTSNIPNSGDIVIKKLDKPDILIDSKNFKANVPKIDLEKFYRDCASNNCSGILCNAFSGIANRDNLQMDIVNGNIYIFLTNHEFNNSLFEAAVNIIYYAYEKFKDKKSDDISIDKEFYARLKLEFNFNLQTFKTHIDNIKQNVNALEKVSFNMLESFLKRSNFTIEAKPIICHICGSGFSSDKTLKKHIKDKHPN